jgi:glycosyltransferase involved in cell wall biosynthesis
MKGVSVVICCYNSKSRIKQTLLHLFNQSLEFNETFEIIIVDNNSTDDTDKYVMSICNDYNLNKIDVKIVSEYKSGLNNARICGVINSRFPLIIFCDDDNWLNNRYISMTISHFKNEINLGCIGGNGEAVFENEKPSWFESHKYGYAAFQISENLIDLTLLPQTVYGAGMALRKDVFLNIIENFNFLTTDRKGRNLNSGGDTELCLFIKLLGYKVFFDPQLKFKHFITNNRTDWKYCRKLYGSFGNSTIAMQPYFYQLSTKKNSFLNWYLQFWGFHFKKIFKSIKRLYFFLFKDLPGEEYITIYETSFKIITQSFIYFPKVYKQHLLLKSKFDGK